MAPRPGDVVPAATSAIAADAVVIGAGPVGLFQVFELGLLDIRAHVIDALPHVGGQPVELYPDKPIYDIPGVPVCTGQGLTDALLRQSAPFAPQFHLGQTVTELHPQADGRWLLATSTGTRFLSKTVFIAAGVGAFEPRRLKLAGIEAHEGQQLRYHLGASSAYAGQDVLILGDTDSAIEAALMLSDPGAHRANSVTLIHRRDSFRASQIMVDRAKANPTITLLTNTVVTSITGTSSPTQNTGAPIAIPGLTIKRPAVAPASVSSIAVRNVVTGEESTLDTNAVFVAIGHTPATDFAAGVVDRDNDGYVVVQGASTVTSAPGIFAAGDCVDRTYRQAISAAGMGCRAALDAQAYLTD